MSSLLPNVKETVTLDNSAWIICRSKSYARRIYYFNTLTGEAVWNLSETEVERAKHRTKSLQRQTDFVMDNNCPEPQESPKDDPTSNKLPSSSINQFCQHNMVPANQQIEPMNPRQFNIPVAPVLNPPIWNADPQQIFVTPTYSQPQPFTSNINYDHLYVNNLSNTPNSWTGLSGDGHANKKIQIRHNKYQHHKSPKKCVVKKHKNKIDLRLLLSLKKIENQIKEKVSQLRTNATHQPALEQSAGSKLSSSERKASTSSSQVKENTDVNCIVPDSNVFLKNINLLNDILNTGEEYCLLVPKIVMTNLQDATKSNCRTLAYKALYFIWQHYEENRAIIGFLHTKSISIRTFLQENFLFRSKVDLQNFKKTANILHEGSKFCKNRKHEGSKFNLQALFTASVILTDDTELINSNNAYNTNIQIITTVKMQQLVDDKCNETTTNIDTQELAHVNTIIENESNFQHNEKVIKSPMRKCMNSEKQAKSSGADNVFQKDNKACDVGVQASCHLRSIFSPCNTDVRDEVLVPDSTKANDNVPRKTGGIKLRRNFSTDQKKKTCQSNDRTKAGNGAESTYPATVSTVNDNTVSDGKNLTWSLFSKISTDSNKINEGSDTSSIVFINVNQREIITIEDSNSAISNTMRNVDTESERGGVQKANTNIDDGIVIFEVSDSRMEKALRVKMDEWVSRFVQIMEEALSQVLEREPTFALEAMPPPWTLHEAAECVRKHFCHDPDVLSAAERLLAVSMDHGGLRGKITTTAISPHKYMELYSYGVYLIDALEGVLSSNEDLQTASGALSELMNDIQQSHLHPGAQDSFPDISAQEYDANVTTDQDTSQVEANQGAKKHEFLKGSPIRNNKKQSPASKPGKRNLRSQRKKILEENRETSDNVTFIRTIDPESSFCSNLDLKNIASSNNKTVTEKPQQIIGLGTSDNIQEKSPSLRNTNEHISSSGESTAPILNGDPKTNEPKIIRYFFKCVEFEEKLKYKTGLLDNQDRTYDDEDEDEGMAGGIATNEDFIENYESNTFVNSDTNYVEELGYNGHNPEENVLGSLENSKALNTNHGDKAITFKLLMQDLESDILKAYTSIRDFCVRFNERLQSKDLSADDTNRMLARAEKTNTYICQICDQLESILRRENTPRSIFQILKKNHSAEVVVEDGDMEDYRDYIGNCLQQGRILKEAIELLLQVCKRKAA